ncbi:MAG: tRNA pseudouridine(55) synthase TruB [Candidatus Saganbacteria bacterium]|nr:tRNA pseudouridine(55) synthase TruB [Candidatus Saganbacteria bacterium]
MDAVVNLNKPFGITSFKAVEIIRDLLKIKKAGHAGTLDPMATGVLIVCLGKACKYSSFLMVSDKEYEAVITFGISTDSGDSDGKVTAKQDVQIKIEDIKRVLKSFIGELEQVPPMVSAIHYKGKRLYELARKGIKVEIKPRKINIYDIKLLDFEDGVNPKAKILVSCSKGTYIRTLCEDIGKSLNVPAHESSLIRTRSGKFTVKDSRTLEEIRKLYENGSLEEALCYEYKKRD